MSDVWKCDKCQRVFEKEGQETRYSGGTHEFGDLSLRSQMTFDLCSDCKKKLDKWLTDTLYLGSDYTFKITADDLVYRPVGYQITPTVYFGAVHPFPASNLDDKEFPKKMLEEAAEVYSAWEDYIEAARKDDDTEIMNCLQHIAYECGDVVQTCANMLSAVQKASKDIQPFTYTPNDNVYDAASLMAKVERSNRQKGRYDA